MNAAAYQMAVEAMASVDVAIARTATVAELRQLSHDAQPWPISGDHIARALKTERTNP